MRSSIAMLGLGASLCLAAAAHGQTPKWDLECRYDNGSIAFDINLAEHRTLGDMVAHNHQISISPSQIRFSVSASETTLLQDFEVTIDRSSLKWSTNKPGWGGACRKL